MEIMNGVNKGADVRKFHSRVECFGSGMRRTDDDDDADDERDIKETCLEMVLLAPS